MSCCACAGGSGASRGVAFPTNCFAIVPREGQKGLTDKFHCRKDMRFTKAAQMRQEMAESCHTPRRDPESISPRFGEALKHAKTHKDMMNMI